MTLHYFADQQTFFVLLTHPKISKQKITEQSLKSMSTIFWFRILKKN